MAELGALARSFLEFLFDKLGPTSALLSVACIYLGWRLYRAERRIEALSDRLIETGSDATEKLTSMAGARLTADMTLADAVRQLSDKLETEKTPARGKAR